MITSMLNTCWIKMHKNIRSIFTRVKTTLTLAMSDLTYPIYEWKLKQIISFEHRSTNNLIAWRLAFECADRQRIVKNDQLKTKIALLLSHRQCKRDKLSCVFGVFTEDFLKTLFKCSYNVLRCLSCGENVKKKRGFR